MPPDHATARAVAFLLARVLAEGGDARAGGEYQLLGLVLATCSSVSGVFGTQLLRLGHVRGLFLVRVFGLVLKALVSPGFDAASLAFAAQSALVIFSGLDAAGTLVVAPYLNGEKLTRRRVCAVLVVAAGCIAVVVAAPHSTSNAVGVGTLVTRPAFGIWAAIFGTLVAGCVRELVRPTMLAQSSGARRGLAFGVLGGLCAGNCWCLQAALRFAVDDGVAKLVSSPLEWIAVAGAAASALTAMWLLMRGTSEYPTVFLVPVFAGSRIISLAMSGLLVMDEARALSTTRLLGYGAAALTVLAGIAVLFMDEDTRPVGGPRCSAGDLGPTASQRQQQLVPLERPLPARGGGGGGGGNGVCGGAAAAAAGTAEPELAKELSDARRL